MIKKSFPSGSVSLYPLVHKFNFRNPTQKIKEFLLRHLQLNLLQFYSDLHLFLLFYRESTLRVKFFTIINSKRSKGLFTLALASALMLELKLENRSGNESIVITLSE